MTNKLYDCLAASIAETGNGFRQRACGTRAVLSTVVYLTAGNPRWTELGDHTLSSKHLQLARSVRSCLVLISYRMATHLN